MNGDPNNPPMNPVLAVFMLALAGIAVAALLALAALAAGLVVSSLVDLFDVGWDWGRLGGGES